MLERNPDHPDPGQWCNGCDNPIPAGCDLYGDGENIYCASCWEVYLEEHYPEDEWGWRTDEAGGSA